MKPGPIMVSALVAVFGLAAVFAAQQWLDQRTHSNLAPVVAAPPVDWNIIVVAVRPLRLGTEIKREHVREVAWPGGATPSGTFGSISDLLSSEGRRAVLSPIERSPGPVTFQAKTGDRQNGR